MRACRARVSSLPPDCDGCGVGRSCFVSTMSAKTTTNNMRRKWSQAQFYLDKIDKERTNHQACAHYFSAYLNAIRSVALYVRHYLEARRGRKLSDSEWGTLMNRW